jgi:diaminohydroxyphosphoribosylaminopyrimidine deaminase/5-amino-6-(5-phosphoribosylamino)uracil reductase
VARLVAGGVKVRPAPFATATEWLNLGHRLRHIEGRPFVQLKLAVDADGFVALGEGRPVWVTGEEARARAHLLRAEADAILIGRTTLLHDNPLLTCRLPGLEQRSPVRIVLTSDGRVPPDADLLHDDGPPVWIVAGAQTPPHVKERLEKAGARLLLIPHRGSEPERLPLRAVASALAQAGITRLLIEGGPTVARAFFEAGIVDEAIIFQGQERMPPGAKRVAPFGGAGLDLLTASKRYAACKICCAGDAVVTSYRSLSHLSLGAKPCSQG